MNKIIYTLLFVFAMMGLASCNDYETYADLKEKEQSAISNFISREGIQVIDELTFRIRVRRRIPQEISLFICPVLVFTCR